MDIPLKRLDLIRKKYREEGWRLVVTKRRSGAGVKRKLSEKGVADVLKAAEGQNASRISKKRRFDAAHRISEIFCPAPIIRVGLRLGCIRRYPEAFLIKKRPHRFF